MKKLKERALFSDILIVMQSFLNTLKGNFEADVTVVFLIAIIV